MSECHKIAIDYETNLSRTSGNVWEMSSDAAKKTMESNRICFIIATMANQVIRDLVLEIKGNFFSIICDEFTDISNKEQLNICIIFDGLARS